jgi:hypothetical protein
MLDIHRINPQEVPTIRNLEDMRQAAAYMAISNCVYIIPAEGIATEFGAVTDPLRQANVLASQLNMSSGDRPWSTYEIHSPRTHPPARDAGFHFDPPTHRETIHLHRTTHGEASVTFAEATEGYTFDQQAAHMERLTALLRLGKTDKRRAKLETFRRVRVPAGASVIFRPHASAGLPPLLHDFETISSRGSQIIDLKRQPEATPRGYLDLNIVAIDLPGAVPRW